MMRKYFFLILCALLLSSPVYAETALEVCTQEAKDAGIEDPEEFRVYVDECVEQVSAEMQENMQQQQELEQTNAERSE